MSIPNSLSLPLNLSLDLILYICYKIISVLKYFVILPRSLKIFDHDPFAFLHHVKLFTECDPYTSIPYSTPEKL